MTPRVDLILRQLDALPALPAVAVAVLEATQRDRVDAAHVTRLIESDPALTAAVLRLARRAGVAAREVTGVSRAVVLLGFAEVRSAVLAQSILQVFPSKGGDSGDSRDSGDAGGATRADFWTHSLAVACAAEMLAVRVARRGVHFRRATDPAEAFCCGLLHDLGKLALHAVLPKSYARIVQAVELSRGNIADLERQAVGVDHQAAGRKLAEKWALPPIVRDAIWLHNQHPDALPEQAKNHAPLLTVVTLADAIARRLRVGYSGNYAAGIPTDLLRDRLGLDDADVEEVAAALIEAVAPRAAALGLDDADAPALYRDALRRADGEVAAAAGRLRDREAQDRRKADAYAAMSRLRRELHVGGGVRETLESVARTAAEALGVGAVAAFSLPPGRADADVLIFANGSVRRVAGASGNDADELQRCRRPDLAQAFGDAETNRVPTPDLAWLERLAGDALPGGDRRWLCLEADGECVGGVLFAATDAPPLDAADLCGGWSLALRLAQHRESSGELADALAAANRRLAEAQEQAARDRALVAVAELAAGAAHEMNNPLMVISGRSRQLYHGLSNVRDKQTALAIHQNADRLSEMISQLMRFAKPEFADVREATAGDVIGDALRQIERLPERVGRDIDVRVPELPPVLIDARQVARAISYLLENALQAVAEVGGRIQIGAAADLTGANLLLTISDDGPGMDEATLRQAGSPFFSRKSAGRRRGMGLALATRLLESNGGGLTLDSRPGDGTRAVVRLPVARPQLAALRKSA